MDIYTATTITSSRPLLSSDEFVANIILWKPKHGYRRPRRPKLDYVTLLTKDTGPTSEELRTAMSDRELRRHYVDPGAPD